MEDLQSRDWSNDQRKLEFRHVSNKKKLGIELWGGRQHVKAQPIWDTQLGWSSCEISTSSAQNWEACPWDSLAVDPGSEVSHLVSTCCNRVEGQGSGRHLPFRRRSTASCDPNGPAVVPLPLGWGNMGGFQPRRSQWGVARPMDGKALESSSPVTVLYAFGCIKIWKELLWHSKPWNFLCVQKIVGIQKTMVVWCQKMKFSQGSNSLNISKSNQGQSSSWSSHKELTKNRYAPQHDAGTTPQSLGVWQCLACPITFFAS